MEIDQMASLFPSMSRKARKPFSNGRRNRRKCLFEPLEDRRLLAGLFHDSGLRVGDSDSRGVALGDLDGGRVQKFVAFAAGT